LVDELVQIRSEARGVDRRGPLERCEGDVSWHETAATHGNQLAYRNAVAGDHKGFPSIKSPHDLPTVVAERTLGNLTRHEGSVARVLRE